MTHELRQLRHQPPPGTRSLCPLLYSHPLPLYVCASVVMPTPLQRLSSLLHRLRPPSQRRNHTGLVDVDAVGRGWEVLVYQKVVMLACTYARHWRLFGIVVFCLLGVVGGIGDCSVCSCRRYLHVKQNAEERRCENEVAGVCLTAEV